MKGSSGERASVVGARVLIAGLAALLVLPVLMQKLLGGNRQGMAVIGSTAALRQVDLLQLLLGAVVAAICLLLSLRDRREAATRAPSLAVLAILTAPWLAMTATNLLNEVFPAPAALGYVLIVVALWRTGAPLTALALLGLMGGLVAAVSLALGSFWPQLGLYANAAGQSVDSGKGLLFDQLLSGVFLSTNNLGQFLALALPGAYLISRRWLRCTCIALSAWAVLWSGSRSSIAAVIAVVLTAAVVRATAADSRRGRAVAAVLLTTSAAICVALPFVGEQRSTSFSGRGRIWHLAITGWLREPWTGQGSDWFLRQAGMRTELGSRSVYTLFHAHNQFLHLLASGGLLVVLATTAMLVLSCRAALRLHGLQRAVAVSCLVAFFVSGSLELNLGLVDRYQFWVTSLVPLVLIAISGTACRSSGRPITAAVAAGNRVAAGSASG